MPRLRASPSWNLSLLKPRRKHKQSQKTNPPHDKGRPETPANSITNSGNRSNTGSFEVWSDAIEDQKDGFYRYSESLIEEERQASLQPDQDWIMVSHHKPNLSSSIQRRPYSISSDQWVVTTAPSPIRTPEGSSPTDSNCSVPRALPLDGLGDAEISMHFPTVLQIFSKVYFVSKVMQIIFMGYGVEVDPSPETGLMYWIEQAERGVRTPSLIELIETTENLFYTTYSRILIELAAVELCACFQTEGRFPTAGQNMPNMPDATHLYRIILSCKDVLDSPALCRTRDESMITRFHDAYVRFIICKDSHRGDFKANDILGFRRYAVSVILNRFCGYYKKWDEAIPTFSEIPAETLTLLAERYFTVIPQNWPARDIPTEDLPFINLAMIDPYTWNKELIGYHRIGTLARLEDKAIGDVRREEEPHRLMNVVMHARCICKSICYCAKTCTLKVDRACPCAERQMRMQLAISRRRSGRFDFKTRINSVVLCGFEGLSVMNRSISDAKIMVELHDIFKIVSIEISKERSPDGMASWPNRLDRQESR